MIETIDEVIDLEDTVDELAEELLELQEIVEKGFEDTSKEHNALNQRIELLAKSIEEIKEKIEEDTEEENDDEEMKEEEIENEKDDIQEDIYATRSELYLQNDIVSNSIKQLEEEIEKLRKKLQQKTKTVVGGGLNKIADDITDESHTRSSQKIQTELAKKTRQERIAALENYDSTMTYNGNNQITTVTYDDGTVINMTYNGSNQVETVAYVFADITYTQTITYTDGLVTGVARS